MQIQHSWNVGRLKEHVYKKNAFNQKDFKVLLAKKKKKCSVFFDNENAGPSKKKKQFCDNVVFAAKWSIMREHV